MLPSGVSYVEQLFGLFLGYLALRFRLGHCLGCLGWLGFLFCGLCRVGRRHSRALAFPLDYVKYRPSWSLRLFLLFLAPGLFPILSKAHCSVLLLRRSYRLRIDPWQRYVNRIDNVIYQPKFDYLQRHLVRSWIDSYTNKLLNRNFERGPLQVKLFRLSHLVVIYVYFNKVLLLFDELPPFLFGHCQRWFAVWNGR